jgi:hypothetical protein
VGRNIPLKEIKVLFARSGGICAFPRCGKPLIVPGNSHDGAAVLAEIAHIVADSRQGPRGRSLLSDEDRDRHPNLVLLCGDHHKIIDSQPTTYSVPVLRQMKTDHEERIRIASSPVAGGPSSELKHEVIHSSLLPVTHLPEAVFAAPCKFSDRQEDEVRKRIVYPQGDSTELVRFVLRDEKLFTFHNLNNPNGPFAKVIDRSKVDTLRATTLWRDAEGFRRYITLLNKALYKYADRLKVRFDPAHQRFYFPTTESGKPRTVSYRPLNANRTNRDVVWQPKKKSTGETRNFWWHLAAGLKFNRMAENHWCLSIRPERHLTEDGVTPLPPEQIGRRVASKKARMWNDIYLSEVNFWRDFLSGGSPRITLNFGDQVAIMDTTFLTFEVDWPGIPGDDKPFKNQTYDDDLFSNADFENAIAGTTLDWDEEEDGDTEEVI